MWDGHNLLSRELELFGALPHIRAWLKEHYHGRALDGELYCHGMKLQDINAIVTPVRQTPHPDHGKITYNVFDLPYLGVSQRERMDILQSFPEATGPIHRVPTVSCLSPDEVYAKYNEYLSKGYEGAIIRSCTAHYEPYRSNYVQKLKPVTHTSGPVVSYKNGTGKFLNAVGAIIVRWNGYEIPIGSGDYTEAQRFDLWKRKPTGTVHFRYYDLSRIGIPIQAQFTRLHEH